MVIFYMSLQPIGYYKFSNIFEMKLKVDTVYTVIVQFVFRKFL